MNKEDFYLNKAEPAKSCLLAMRNILLSFNDHMMETVKYGMPCFLYKDKVLCYLWMDKKTMKPYFLVSGKIEHEALERGNRKSMKILAVNPDLDLPMDIIHEILTNAISLKENI